MLILSGIELNDDERRKRQNRQDWLMSLIGLRSLLHLQNSFDSNDISIQEEFEDF